MADVTFQIQFALVNCAECGVYFGIQKRFEEDRRRDHKQFYCPSGHSNWFLAESDLEQVKREKREIANFLQAQLNEANHARLVAEKERDKIQCAKRKIERRVAAGVCPCCNRTFEDLHRHMQTKHKDYALPAGQQKQITGTVQ